MRILLIASLSALMVLAFQPTQAEACGWSPYKAYKNAKSPKRRMVGKLLENKKWAEALAQLEIVRLEAQLETRFFRMTQEVNGKKRSAHGPIYAKKKRLTQCFKKYSGDMTEPPIGVDFTVSARRRPGELSFSGGTPKLQQCITRAMKRLRHKKEDVGAEVSYSFSFAPQERIPFVGIAYYRYQVATAHYHLGDLEAARKTLAGYAPRVAAEDRWQVFLLLANVAKTPVEAIPFAKNAVTLRPKDARLHASLGTFYEKAGQLSEAETSIAMAVSINKNHHGGMEGIHLEVVRFRIQLKADPESYKSRPFLAKTRATMKPDALKKAITFAKSLAPELPIQ